MSFIFEPLVRKLPLASKLGDACAGQKNGCAVKPFAAAFPGEAAKVALISVDTAGRGVLFSGQEGICVQWR
jgi:hypothetical protein